MKRLNASMFELAHVHMHVFTKTKDNRRAHSTVINILNLFNPLPIFYAIYIKLINDFENSKAFYSIGILLHVPTETKSNCRAYSTVINIYIQFIGF